MTTVIAAYLVGSIPTAFLITRRLDGRDLRAEGSRNIGARNAYEVTSNKSIGFAVLLLDMLKGALPIGIVFLLGRSELIPYAAAAVVLGHCYPIYLRFHGGRGLATAAAILLMVSPLLLAAWLLFYLISSVFRRNVHFQSMIATFGVVVIELVLYQDGYGLAFSVLPALAVDPKLLHYAVILIAAIIISRHVQPVTEYLKST